MKIIILANNEHSFVKPLAEGLSKMLLSLGEEPIVISDGEPFLREYAGYGSFYIARTLCKNVGLFLLNEIFSKKYRLHPLAFSLKKKQLIDCDLIILISTIPTAFLKDYYIGLEDIRGKFKKPIVLYDVLNLATRGAWIDRIRKDGGFGLERYDSYLSAAVISEFPMLKDFGGYSLIGMDLRDGSLYPEKGEEFLAVLDFTRKGFESEREIQMQALKETNTPYIELDRPMSINEIRRIYRRAHLFFLSFRESFGLPIVELQLCGSYICAPYKNWAPSHYIGKSIYDKGEGALCRNFIIYDNDKEILKRKIKDIKSSYNPEAVIEEFKNCYPHLYSGDLSELRKSIDKVKSGAITYNSHKSYQRFNEHIITAL